MTAFAFDLALAAGALGLYLWDARLARRGAPAGRGLQWLWLGLAVGFAAFALSRLPWSFMLGR